ncbi:MAG: helix-turn-helix domain-containing protein [Citricoccus sp.]
MTLELATMPPEVEVGEADSIDEWQRIAGNRFVPLSLLANHRDGFHASMRSREIEGITISEITATAHRVRRTAHLISTRDPQHYKLSLQIEGTGIVSQDGREAVLQPGDISLYDTSRPYTLDFTKDLRCLVIAFPRECIGVPPHLIRRITAVRLRGDHGIGTVISPIVQHIVKNLDVLSGINGERILRSSLDLVSALAYSELASSEDGIEQSRMTEMQALKLYIDSHLDDPDLGAPTIASAHYMSMRYLQYLFQDEGTTVSSYIRTRRLERCRLDLCDAALATYSVSRIAQRWCFSDASHFSKLFKSVYGMAPGQFRELHS